MDRLPDTPRQRLIDPTNHAPNRQRPISVARVAFWAICHFVFYFLQQIAEVLAPLLLIIGIGWGVMPRLIGLLSARLAADEPQIRDAISANISLSPNHLQVGALLISPGRLVIGGLSLMALAALAATLTAFAARNA